MFNVIPFVLGFTANAVLSYFSKRNGNFCIVKMTDNMCVLVPSNEGDCLYFEDFINYLAYKTTVRYSKKAHIVKIDMTIADVKLAYNNFISGQL